MDIIKKTILAIIVISLFLGILQYFFGDKKITSNIDFPTPSVTLSGGIKFE